jgi:cytochrome c2
MFRRLPNTLAIIALCLSHSLSTRAAEPFIAGFDRFSEGKSNEQTNGRVLLTELNCTACHSADKNLKPKGGPVLSGAGNRIKPDWIANYLRSPSSEKSGGTMPHMMHLVSEKDRNAAIASLVAFLSSETANEPKIVASGGNPVAHEFWLKGELARGRTLYHQIGCIACHAMDERYQVNKSALSDLERKIASLNLEPDELEEMGLVLPKDVRPVPMSTISSKYTLRSLSMFLIAPHLVRPAGRMPNLKLQPHEAADLAAYLIEDSRTSLQRSTSASNVRAIDLVHPSDFDESLVQQGKALFASLSCTNCHTIADVKPVMSKPLKSLDINARRGCLTDDNSGPIFGLSDAQKVAVRASIEAIQSESSKAETVANRKADELTFTMLQLNCYACHERGGRGGVGPKQWPFFENTQQIDIGDEGRLPPPLDHVGRKLKANWLQNVLEGKGELRPHFRARMPTFSDHGKSLAAAFVEVDNAQPPLDAKPPDAIAAKNLDLHAGRDLMDSGCVQCHAFRTESLPGTIGIDIADIGMRVQREWFEAFLLNPASLKRNTRMPTFFPDGKSSVPHVLDGNVGRQIESLWGYLNAANAPLPNKLEQSRSQLFELAPKDTPIVLRTFMESKSAGTSAIAVGLPEQIHYAFDAHRIRLAEIWKGKFLNAQSTWYDRFAPPAIPLGTERVLLPSTSFFSRDSSNEFTPIDSSRLRFQGYRLDSQRLPVFRYTVDSRSIEDSIQADFENGLVRRIKVLKTNSNRDQEANPIWLLVSDDVVQVESETASTRSNLKLQISTGVEQNRIPHGETSDWMVLLTDQNEVEVRYRW